MFREFEKTAEKETPGMSFFVKLCLSGPKKYKNNTRKNRPIITIEEYFSWLVTLTWKSKKAVKTTSFRNH